MGPIKVLSVLFFIYSTCSSSTPSSETVLDFLIKYGYVRENEGLMYSIDTAYANTTIQEGLIRLQEFYNLPLTGELDEETIKLIKSPRCGNMDIPAEYTVVKKDDKWSFTNLTWYLSKIHDPAYIQVAGRAFNVWSMHTNLEFKYSMKMDSNIVISFNSGGHMTADNKNNCSGKAFDGVGGVLAHAFLPHIHRRRVEIHLDEHENWNLSDNVTDDSTSLFLVLVHEIGHTLGLYHSHHKDAIMYGNYISRNISNFKLAVDDITRIQTLYGVKKTDDERSADDVITTKPAMSEETESRVIKQNSPPHMCDVDIKYYGFLIFKKTVYIFNRTVWYNLNCTWEN